MYYINCKTGQMTATQFNGSGAGLTGTASNLQVAAANTLVGFSNTTSYNPIVANLLTCNGIGYTNGISLFGQTDGGIYSSSYSSAWTHQIYGDFRTGQLAVRGQCNGAWQPWRTVVDSGNIGSQRTLYAHGLHRNDSTDDYNIQPTWSADVSGYWSLRGYLVDTFHAPCYVERSGIAGSAGLLSGPARTIGDGWFRSSGACGWVNESYGTGIYSDCPSIVKTYNGAALESTGNGAAGGLILHDDDGTRYRLYVSGGQLLVRQV